MLFLFLCDFKLNILGFWTFTQRKQDIFTVMHLYKLRIDRLMNQQADEC